eukprot:CFRG7337T1
MEKTKERYKNHHLQKSLGALNYADNSPVERTKSSSTLTLPAHPNAKRCSSETEMMNDESPGRTHSRTSSVTRGIRDMLRGSIGATEFHSQSLTVSESPNTSLAHPSLTKQTSLSAKGSLVANSSLYLNGVKVEDLGAFYSVFSNAGDWSSSDGDIEESDTEVEGDVVEESRRNTKKKRLTGEDYAIYVLAVRCFLAPLIDGNAVHRERKKWSSSYRLTWAKEASVELYYRKVTAADVSSIIERTVQEIEKQNKKANVDEVYVKALTTFTQKATEDRETLMSKGFNTAGDFIRIFNEIARLCLRKMERRVDEDSLRGLKSSFEALVEKAMPERDVLKAQRKASSIDRLDLAGNSRGKQPKKPFTQCHTALARIYHAPRREHMEVLGREERLNTPEVILEELKLRKFGLDTHPTYNKDTFVHKTASFLKWRKQEEEKINKLMSVVAEGNSKMMKDVAHASSMNLSGGTLNTPATKVNSRRASSTSLKSNGSGCGGDFIVGILKARNLAQEKKRGSGNVSVEHIPSPYCLVEFGSQNKRTTSVVKNSTPMWREQCTFAVTPQEDSGTYTFKVLVMDEAAGQGRIIKRSDGKLGRVKVTLNKEDLKFPMEKWFKLENSHRKGLMGGSMDGKVDEMCGEVCLRIEYRTNDQKAAEEAAKQAAEKEKREEKRLMELAKKASTTNYNKLYESLYDRIFEYELARCEQAGKIFSIRSIYVRLLEEFRTRYGVGKLFAAVLMMNRLIVGLENGTVSIESYWYMIHYAAKLTEGLAVRWTQSEMEMFEKSVDKLEGVLINKLSHYKDYFPYSTPKGQLTMYVRCIEDLYNSTLFREKNQHAKDVTAVIQMCVVTCCKTLYSRYEAMAAPSSPYPTQAQLGAQVNSLVSWIIAEMTNDAVYFATDFTRMDGEPILDLVQVSVSTFGQLLWTDVDCVMLEHFQDSFNEDVLALYFKLQEFNSWCLENSDFPGFDLEDTWAPYIKSWLAEVRAKSLANVKRLVEQEKWQPVSDLELHSTSSMVLLNQYTSLYSFLDNLRWDDKIQYNHFICVFTESVANTVREYCIECSLILRTHVGKNDTQPLGKESGTYSRASDTFSNIPESRQESVVQAKESISTSEKPKYFKASQQACVLMNNIEIVRQKMQQLCSDMHVEQAFTQAAEMALVRSGSNAMSRTIYASSSKSTLSDVDESVNMMQNSASIIFNTMASMSTSLATRVCAPLTEILVGLAEGPNNFNSFVHSVSTWNFGKAPSSSNKNSLEELHLQRLRDFERSLQLSLAVMSEMEYLNVYLRSLAAVWEEILRLVERLIVDEKYDRKRLGKVEEALKSLWACVHADGNGLQAETLTDNRYKILLEVLTAVKSDDGERIVTLHMFSQDDVCADAFLLEIMKKCKDKHVQSYINSLR